MLLYATAKLPANVWQVKHLHQQGELAWLRLFDGVRTGEDMFQVAYGKHLFDYLRADPAQEALFSRAMANLDHAGGHLTFKSLGID